MTSLLTTTVIGRPADRVLEERRRDEILNLSKPELPVPTLTVSLPKPELVTISASPALMDVPVAMGGRQLIFPGIEEHTKHLLHHVAEKLEAFADEMGKKWNKLGQKAAGIFGAGEDHTKSTAPVDIAIALVAVIDAPSGKMFQPVSDPSAAAVDQPEEQAIALDQISKPEDNESEVNPFVLAQKNEVESNKRVEDHVCDLDRQLLAAKPVEEMTIQPNDQTHPESVLPKDKVADSVA